MLTVGNRFPSFNLPAVEGSAEDLSFTEISGASHPGRWRVFFWWPMDFTFVCPTEIAEFGRRSADFARLGAVVLGASTDTRYVHLAWRQAHRDLRDLPIAMLADHQRHLSQALGILHPTAGVALRATFIVDPQGIIRWAAANDLEVGRDVDEVLRVLAALQAGGLTPCNWKPGQKTLAAG